MAPRLPGATTSPAPDLRLRLAASEQCAAHGRVGAIHPVPYNLFAPPQLCDSHKELARLACKEWRRLRFCLTSRGERSVRCLGGRRYCVLRVYTPVLISGSGQLLAVAEEESVAVG